MRHLSFITALLMAAYHAPTTTPLYASEINQVESLTAWEDLVFEIEDTKTRVGIASVKLIVSTLKPEGGNLVGDYNIVVPLMQSQNDSGRIILPLLDSTVGELGKKGGILRGLAISNKGGTTPNSIICEVLPLKNKTILLEIQTENRTLEFKSKYTVSVNQRSGS
jgi:hypothetical protein